MSGAVAAHAAYNGSGTQGLAVTNKIHEADSDVMSVFWNKNDTTRQLLYSSSFIEIPSSGATTLDYGSSRLFTVNNDIDCLGDIYLQIGENFHFQIHSLTLINYGSVTITNPSPPTGNIIVKHTSPFILDLIDRIEVQVGTQIWQTLEHHDLYVLTAAELEHGAFTETIVNGSKFNTHLFIRIPCLTKTLGPQLSKFTQQTENGYPMAAAPHQSVKFKVYFADKATPLTTINDSSNDIIFGFDNIKDNNGNTKTLHDSIDPGDTFDILINIISGTDFFVIPGYSVTTGDSNVSYVTYLNNFQTLSDVCTVNTVTSAKISSCKMYAKQQIMCNEEREQIKAMPMGLPKRLKMTQNAYLGSINGKSSVTINLDHFSLYASHLLIAIATSNTYTCIKTAELKLNSSSFSGALPGTLLYSATSESLGIYCNKHIYALSDGVTAPYEIYTYNFYTFPLAATAYSGSSVPLNRFDSIRLTITFSSSVQQGAVSVTCVGETTALFKDGAASLAMY